MRWPWVSREMYELAIGDCNAKYESLRQSERRYDALLDKYHALRSAGASLPEPKSEPLPAKEPDIVTQAIIAKSRGNPALRKHYADYVREQRAMNVSDEDIAAGIIQGDNDDGGVPA